MKLIFHINYFQLIHSISKICKVFANGSSANMKLSKTRLSKIKSGGFKFSLPSDIIFNKGVIPLVSSIAKESRNMCAKKTNKYIFVDAGLNLIGKKIKKGIS